MSIPGRAHLIPYLHLSLESTFALRKMRLISGSRSIGKTEKYMMLVTLMVTKLSKWLNLLSVPSGIVPDESAQNPAQLTLNRKEKKQ